MCHAERQSLTIEIGNINCRAARCQSGRRNVQVSCQRHPIQVDGQSITAGLDGIDVGKLRGRQCCRNARIRTKLFKPNEGNAGQVDICNRRIRCHSRGGRAIRIICIVNCGQSIRRSVSARFIGRQDERCPVTIEGHNNFVFPQSRVTGGCRVDRRLQAGQVDKISFCSGVDRAIVGERKCIGSAIAHVSLAICNRNLCWIFNDDHLRIAISADNSRQTSDLRNRESNRRRRARKKLYRFDASKCRACKIVGTVDRQFIGAETAIIDRPIDIIEAADGNSIITVTCTHIINAATDFDVVSASSRRDCVVAVARVDDVVAVGNITSQTHCIDREAHTAGIKATKIHPVSAIVTVDAHPTGSLGQQRLNLDIRQGTSICGGYKLIFTRCSCRRRWDVQGQIGDGTCELSHVPSKRCQIRGCCACSV